MRIGFWPPFAKKSGQIGYQNPPMRFLVYWLCFLYVKVVLNQVHFWEKSHKSNIKM